MSVQKNGAEQGIDHVVDYVVEAPFDLIVREKGDFTVFAPKGRLNNATRALFKDRLYDAAEEPGCRIIFNLRFVDSIDSVGLGTLISAHKKAVEKGGMIVYTEMNERIFKTMKMLYMDRFLNMASDMKEAVEMMSS
ncbi:STAS domain-containing protein [Maridesulfovibrio sp.]|uniref:STAS domain-containing protein n=1 Tax=Maridesulfovibrio sp. TaxID=2795000 RepID=UPI002A1895B0|nr:STAS domain-containing protein [Maridesulfovibrio sp.]